MLSAEEIEERFEELLKEAKDDAFGNLIKEAAQKGLSLEQKEFMVDKGGNSDLIVPKISNLNKQFYLNNMQINSRETTFFNFPMYFILLWTIIDEVKIYFSKHTKSSLSLQKQLELPDSFIESMRAAESAIDDFKSQLSTEELHTVEFLRNNSCHLTTSKYQIQWNNKSQTFSKDVNGIYRGDIRKKISAELAKHDNNIEKVAAFIADKTYPKLQTMFDSIVTWEKEN